jgi:uncharacterized Fe-S cluster-containing radical SAM superfamily protein
VNRTSRVKIVTGLRCNIQCVFCYYQDNLSAPNRSFAEIRADLELAYRNGVREVDFSGGEPTVHAELPELISYAKELGMQRCCIISNGVRLADEAYLISLRDAGLDEILFSVHGPDAATHDEITQRAGSFAKITLALGHASRNGLAVRVNTVVNKINYQGLSRLAEQLLELHPVQVNFITINDWCFAKHLVDRYLLSYSEMSGYLKGACDILAPGVPAVNVRYIPFCFMQGYEQFVCDHPQVVYDPYEWVPRVRARLEQGTGALRYLGILGYGFVLAGAWRGLLRKPLAEVLDDCVVEGLRRWFYVKSPQCRGCSRRELCDGVERSYRDRFGLDELTAVPGARLRDPVAFRRGNPSRCTKP